MNLVAQNTGFALINAQRGLKWNWWEVKWLYLFPQKMIADYSNFDRFFRLIAIAFSLRSNGDYLNFYVSLTPVSFDLKAAFMRHSASQQCCREAFLALAGCEYIVSMTCIQNSNFASSHSHWRVSERRGGRGMQKTKLMQMTAEKWFYMASTVR